MPCSQEAFERVWRDYHATRQDPVPVDRKSLAELLACDGETPAGMIKPAKRVTTIVRCDRSTLFNFLSSHHF